MSTQPTTASRKWLRRNEAINRQLSAFVRAGCRRSKAKRRAAIERGKAGGVMAEAQTAFRVNLPWPPSVNNLYINAGRKRVRSPRYRKWQDEAGWALKAARPPAFDGPVSVTIELCPPDNRRLDADNRNKPILDLLVSHGVIKDDDSRHVRSVTARFVKDRVHSCTVIVEAVA